MFYERVRVRWVSLMRYDGTSYFSLHRPSRYSIGKHAFSTDAPKQVTLSSIKRHVLLGRRRLRI